MRSVALGVALAVSLGTTVWADDNRFTAADVLGWEPSQKDWYFEVATGMATVVASRSRSPAARCINDWYFANDSLRAARNNEMRALLRRYRDYHPSNVIAAVIEKECGPIGATQ